MNHFILAFWDLTGTGTNERGLKEAAIAFTAFDVQTCAELKDITALIFGAALDDRDRGGMGSKMAAFCADLIHALEERSLEFWERDAETGKEVGKIRFFNGDYGN